MCFSWFQPCGHPDVRFDRSTKSAAHNVVSTPSVFFSLWLSQVAFFGRERLCVKTLQWRCFNTLFDIQHRNVWSLDAEKKHPSETNKESQWIFFL